MWAWTQRRNRSVPPWPYRFFAPLTFKTSLRQLNARLLTLRKKEKKNTHTLTHIPSCTRCWPSYCKPPLVFKTPIPPPTQSNNQIALDLDAKRILANEFSFPHPVRLLFVDLRQRESYRNKRVKRNWRTRSHIYRVFPQSNATPRHVQYAKMRVLRLGHNCTRQNGAVRLSPARIKATNMFSFLFHQEASPFCLPVCVCVCVC